MTNFIRKISFLFLRPLVIIVAGKGRLLASENIIKILRIKNKIRRIPDNIMPLAQHPDEILIFESAFDDPEDLKRAKFIIGKSRRPILLVTHFGEIPDDRLSFSSQPAAIDALKDLAKILPSSGILSINFDDEGLRPLMGETKAQMLTFGLQEGANFKVSDINISPEEANFKVNYMGYSVPFWLSRASNKEQIYAALSAINIAVSQGMNLVEISQVLKL